jgi:hypothetical protein
MMRWSSPNGTPKHASLLFLGIRDHAAHKMLRRAFRFRQRERQPACAARLRRTDRQALGLGALYNFVGKLLEIAHTNHRT